MSIDGLHTTGTLVYSFAIGYLILMALWFLATAVMLAVHNPVGLLALLALLLVPTALGYMTLTLSGWL